MNSMGIAWTQCELQYDYLSDEKHETWRSNFCLLMRFAHTLINPWRIVRSDGVVIACSYDGFTPIAQAAANGRADAPASMGE